VADALADILTGGDTHVSAPLTDSDLAQLEREHFLSLLKTDQTKKRVAHTLKTGKPLREDPARNGKNLDELRAMRSVVKLSTLPLTGQPFQGTEAFKLKIMADVTAILLKKFAG
jgi:hypothetical protein